MTAIKPSPSPSASDSSRSRSRAPVNNPVFPSLPFPQPSFSPSPCSPPPSPSCTSPPPSPSAFTLTLAPTQNSNNDNNINSNATTTTTHPHRSGKDHRGSRIHHQSHIHNHNHGRRHSRHLTSPSNSQRSHARRYSASAYYAGPVEHDRAIHTANAHAEAAASGILSPRLRNSRPLLSPRGLQPQRHLYRQQRQQQLQQRRNCPLPFTPLFPPHQASYRKETTNSRGPFYSNPSTVSPSSSASVVSPHIILRSSSMPLVHTRPVERQSPEAAVTLRHLPLQSPFYRLPQQPQQHQQEPSQGFDMPVDGTLPNALLIHQKLLQVQEAQQQRQKQQEQRLMQAYRIKKFSDSNNDLEYPPRTTFKEGFEQVWGENIVEEVDGEEEENQREKEQSSMQARQEVNPSESTNDKANGDFKERLQRQQQDQELMETDSVMETEKTGDGDGDEDMDPQTRLERAREAREDAIKLYEEAGRKLQRAREREEAIMYEYEVGLFEVEVGSSASQQHHRHQRHGHQQLSPFVELQRDEEARSRHSSPTTTAAAAAVTFPIQHDSNNEAMLRSRVVPQVSDTPSVFSETPQTQSMHIMAPQSIAEPTPVPTSAPVSTPLEQILPVLDQQRQRVTPTEVAESQILDQTRGRSQSRSSDDSAPNEQVLIPQQHQQQHQHNSNSPRIKIKSEEREESVQKRHLLGGEYKVGQDSKSWPLKYADFDIIIDIPSSVGSDIGLSGQPESSNAYERRCQEGKVGRRTHNRWRSPTPIPASTHHARHGKGRQQGPTWEAIHSSLKHSVRRTPKIAPVDLLGQRSESQQRPYGSSSSRPVLQTPPRSSAPRPRPYPPPLFMPRRRPSEPQAPVGGLPSNFFARGMPTRPPPPPSPSPSSRQPQQHRQQRDQGQGQGQERSSPMETPQATFAGQAHRPSYGSRSSPQMPWRLSDFVDENSHPYPTVIFYTHIDHVDHFYHQHHPNERSGVSLSPRMPNFFARPPGVATGRDGMEDAQGNEYEDIAMEGERPQSQSRTSSRQGGYEHDEEMERKHELPAKSESPRP